jgi:hypothetical protein
VLQALITFAQAGAEEEESSKTAFYIAGAILAAFAVIVAAVGIRSHETFPSSRGAANAVMALAVVLVVAVMASAVLTS